MSFSAIIKFYGKDKGGRFTPPRSGYRPQMRVDKEYTSCIIKPEDENIDIMEFGIEYPVIIELIFEDIYKDKISENMKIEFYEGSRLTGTGILTERRKKA